MVSVSPPTNVDQLDEKIDELNKKMKKYQDDGEKALNMDKEKLEKEIEAMVDKDIEEETKARDDDEYGEEEEEKKRDDGPKFKK